jgi:hypothetical protein
LKTTFPFGSLVAAGVSVTAEESLFSACGVVVGLLKTAVLKSVFLQRLNV